MRAFTTKEMVMLYHFTKTSFIVGGLILIGYGIWILIDPTFIHFDASLSFFGILPIYVGGMLILVAIAMKEDWFTNARRYW